MLYFAYNRKQRNYRNNHRSFQFSFQKTSPIIFYIGPQFSNFHIILLATTKCSLIDPQYHYKYFCHSMDLRRFIRSLLLLFIIKLLGVRSEIVTLNTLEDLYRQLVSFQNMKMIEEVNQEGLGFQLAPNKFIDLTQQEFKQLYGSTVEEKEDSSDVPLLGAILPAKKDLNIDWRLSGKVSPVSNQGKTCNSCYAFAAIADIQTSYLLANQRVILSPQQIIDCSEPQGNHGCTNGFYGYAFDYAITNPVSLQANYPYQGLAQSCKASPSSQGYKISSYSRFNGNDCGYLQRTLSLRPVVVSVDGVNFYWQFYSNGLLTFCGNSNSLNHGVQVVGVQSSSDGTGWWIVKNSWGSSWGEDGYIRLDRSKSEGNICKICSYIYYSIL